VVAWRAWDSLAELTGIQSVVGFESMATFQLGSKKHAVYNMFSSAIMWGWRELRNNMCFQSGMWRNMSQLWRKVTQMPQVQELVSALPGQAQVVGVQFAGDRLKTREDQDGE
jgi:hypothetical protein